jgi:hypothetical protein
VVKPIGNESTTNADDVLHSNNSAAAVEVQAGSLYEAVALAVAEFRADDLAAMPGPMTEFTVSIQRPAIEHRVRLSQLSRWAEGSTSEGPAGLQSHSVSGLFWTTTRRNDRSDPFNRFNPAQGRGRPSESATLVLAEGLCNEIKELPVVVRFAERPSTSCLGGEFRR